MEIGIGRTNLIAMAATSQCMLEGCEKSMKYYALFKLFQNYFICCFMKITRIIFDAVDLLNFLLQRPTRNDVTSNKTSLQMSHVTRKPVFGSLRPGKTQPGLLSYRS